MKNKSDLIVLVLFIFAFVFCFASCQTTKKVVEENQPIQQEKIESPITHSSKYYELYEELSTGLPLLAISVKDSKKIERNSKYYEATIEYINSQESDFIDELALVKARGNTSWVYFPKKPYTIKLSKSKSLFEKPKSKKWVLISNYSDKTLIRNAYASELASKVFTNLFWTASNKNVDVVINGKFAGNYALSEQIKIAKDRVNIQSISKTVKKKGNDLNGDGLVDINDGGFILEVDFRQDDEFCWKTRNNCFFSLKDPKPNDFEDFSKDIKAHIKGIVQTAENAVYSLNGYEQYLDLDSWVDWCILNDFLRNTDSISWVSSAYMYYEPLDGKLHMGPIWDFDIAMGNYKQDEYGDLYSPNIFCDKRRWLSKLYKDPAFTNKIKQRWQEIRLSVLESINFDVQTLANKNTKSSEENFKVWPILGTYVWPAPPGYAERTSYQSEVDYLITWLNARWQWFDKNIDKL